ncbi:hypothetical protein [Roseovarius sp. MMSF_3359]|uniref:hypothetical protein n=1 Tax=Roseovarius sp. MMSF_3359 TaxID=3046707 RepID=UPI00273EA336|nr:hypothetical protein [Roseovarius sp. MMSF_3359]
MGDIFVPFDEMWNSALINQLLSSSLLLPPLGRFAHRLGDSDACLRISNATLNVRFEAFAHHLDILFTPSQHVLSNPLVDAVDRAGDLLAVSSPNARAGK